ncbi:hypothetical protein J4408_02780 [Candidatus Pacearchaeota archaeon]|nr:hypothetical protein [Candidatus Pacearchaeota archaeon]
MQTKFKRHQKVKLLVDPNPEYVEYHNQDEDESVHPIIKKGMKGKINILLSNGQYHVEIIDEKGNTIAYIPMQEEYLEAID